MGTNFQGISALAVGLAGVATTIKSTVDSYKASKQLMESAKDEATAILSEGDELKKNAQQKAYAAMRDIQFLNAISDANERALDQDGRRVLSHVVAHTAGSGIRQTGSPLYLEADAALQFERAKQNQELTRRLGTKRFQFVVDQQLEVAANAQPTAETHASALLDLRASQAGNIRIGAIQGLNQGIYGAGRIAANRGTKELFDGLFPKTTKPSRAYDPNEGAF